jgi:hypothetical protein
MNRPLPSTLAQRNADAAQARFAQRVTAALTEHQAKTANPDIDARLRFAHDQHWPRRAARVKWPPRHRPWSAPQAQRPCSAAVLVRHHALVAPGLVVAGGVARRAGADRQYYTCLQIEAAAEVDAAILTDDLPPEAYRDQGFVEFLKTARP